MQRYIIRRVVQAIPILLGVTVITFLLMHAAPGDPFSGLISPRITGEDLERMRRVAGLDDPLHIQYFKWLWQLLQGNFGYSFTRGDPVAKLIAERMWITFTLSAMSQGIGLLIGVPFGIISALRQYSLVDNVLTVIGFAGLSMPTFFVGLLGIKVLALDLDLFPTAGVVTLGANYPFPWNYVDVLYHLTLPALVLGFYSVAGLMRYARSSMLETLTQDYVRTARAKGLSERVVVYKHALRNSLIPVITLLGLNVPALFSGAILTETVFSMPGMGRLGYQAVVQRDYPIIKAVTLFLAFLTVVGNLLADIAYAWVDPRIRYD